MFIEQRCTSGSSSVMQSDVSDLLTYLLDQQAVEVLERSKTADSKL